VAKERDYQDLQDRIGAMLEQVVNQLAADLLQNPQLADATLKTVNDLEQSVIDADNVIPPPPDKGLAELIGVGPEASTTLGGTRMPQGVVPYDEEVTSDRLVAVGDLYYIFQHEMIGVFRVMQKLKSLFRDGAVRLSSGPGAFALYQYDRREVLRFTQRDRWTAYRRVLGYGNAPVGQSAIPNKTFHKLFSHFNQQVALYWRDKRISDVMRERAYDPSFGSIAIVRRSGLDLRNNLKFMSFGQVNVMRVEVMQLLDEAFRILDAEDIRQLFGAENAWDVVEEVLVRYFNERLVTSPRQRMAVAGREVLRWLAQRHILKDNRVEFEAMLLQIAEYAEEWLTSAEAMGAASRDTTDRVIRRNVVPGTARSLMKNR
jgi:hypothetical protein